VTDPDSRPSWRERALAKHGDSIRARAEEWAAEQDAAEEDDAKTAPVPDGLPMPLWRVGRKVEKTIYRQVGTEPSDSDPLIGVMFSAEDAAQVVEAVNAMRTRLKHGGGNAEDCPICCWRRDLYPFICPGDAPENNGGEA
jgi:hypothetical protein